MGRIIRPTLALMLALFARPGPAVGPAPRGGPEPPAYEIGPAAKRSLLAPVDLAIDRDHTTPVPAEDAAWYEPSSGDFRPHYDRDTLNQRKQTWGQYWSWVVSFYQGNYFSKGWSDRAKWLVEGVRSEAARGRLRAKLNAVGREICAEWAKDYDARKVTSADLLSWGKLMEAARSVEDGTGAALERAIDAVRADHGRRLAGGGTGSAGTAGSGSGAFSSSPR